MFVPFAARPDHKGVMVVGVMAMQPLAVSPGFDVMNYVFVRKVLQVKSSIIIIFDLDLRSLGRSHSDPISVLKSKPAQRAPLVARARGARREEARDDSFGWPSPLAC